MTTDYTTKQEATINYSDLDTLKEDAPDFETEAARLAYDLDKLTIGPITIDQRIIGMRRLITTALRTAYESGRQKGFEECRERAVVGAKEAAELADSFPNGRRIASSFESLANLLCSLTPGEDG